MAFPLHHLPVLQNWDCHVCGTCCQEYQVTITDEEASASRRRAGTAMPTLAAVSRSCPTARANPGSTSSIIATTIAVFFSATRGDAASTSVSATRPNRWRAGCFPFVLVPVADEWRVGLRFACPVGGSTTKGRAIAAHKRSLAEFAAALAQREGLTTRPDGSLTPPPALERRPKAEWPDVLRLVDVLLGFLRNRRDPMERRLRKCLTLAAGDAAAASGSPRW